MKARHGAIAIAVLVSLAVGCGASGGTDMTAAASAELRADVREIRDAVARDDLDTATQLVRALRTTVITMTTTGRITDDRAERIIGAIDELETEIAARVGSSDAQAPTTVLTTTNTTTTSSTPTTTSSTPTTTQRGDKPEDAGKNNNKNDKKRPRDTEEDD